MRVTSHPKRGARSGGGAHAGRPPRSRGGHLSRRSDMALPPRCGVFRTVLTMWVAVGCGIAAPMCHAVTAAVAPAAEPLTVGLVAGDGGAAPPEIFGDLLFAGLSGEPGIELVERQRIRAILSEHELQASGLVDPAAALQLGKLVGVDILVLLDREERIPESPCRVLAIETRTGIRLGDVFVESTRPERATGDSMAMLRSAMARARVPSGERRFVGILDFRSEEPAGVLLPVAEALGAMVAHDLCRIPEVVVLERREMQRLTAEHDLTKLELQLKRSAALLEVGLRRQGTADMVIKVKLTRPGADSWIASFVTATGDVAAARRKITAAVAGELDAEAPAALPGFDTVSEAAYFAAQAEALLSLRRPLEATSRAESALALSPSLDHYQLAYRAWVVSNRLLDSELDCARAALRANEISLAYIREFQRQQRDNRVKRLHGTAYIYGPGLEDDTSPLGEELADIQARIRALTEEKQRICFEFAWRHDIPCRSLLIERMTHVYDMHMDPKGFMQDVRAQIEEYQREESLYPHAYDRVRFAVACRDVLSGVKQRPRWPQTAIVPLLDWLAGHRDVGLRLAGFAGRLRLGRAEGTAAAYDILQTCLNELLSDPEYAGLMSQETLFQFTDANPLLYLRQIEYPDLAEYLEARLDQLLAGDPLRLLALPEVVARSLWSVRPEAQRYYITRIEELLDKKQGGPELEPNIAHLRNQLTLMRSHLAKTLPAEPDAESSPWDDFDIKEIAIENRAPGHRLVRYQLGGDAFVLVWDTDYFVHGAARKGDIVITRLPFQGGEQKEFSRLRDSDVFVTSVCAGSNAVYVGTDDGVIVAAADEVKLLGVAEGVPAGRIDHVAWLDGKLYMAQEASLVRFDPRTETFDTIAAARAVHVRHGLDGGAGYQILSLLSDPARHCLWLGVYEHGSGRRGLWKIECRTDTVSQVYSSRRHVIGQVTMQGDALLFEQDGLRRLNMETLQCEGVTEFANSIARTSLVLVGDGLLASGPILYTKRGVRCDRHFGMPTIEHLQAIDGDAVGVDLSAGKLWRISALRQMAEAR